MVRRVFRAEVGFFLAIWLVLMVVGRTALFRDPGTFWHVVVGQRILESGCVPHVDSFSFTMAGRPWIAHQWLAEVAMAALHALGGWDTLLLATVTLLAAVYACIGSRLLRCGLHVVPAVLVVALVLMTSTHNFHVRPLVVTIALQAWTFGLLVDVEAGRAPIRRLWWLVPVFVLWSNLHGGVLGGIGTVGLTVSGWCLLWIARRGGPVRSLRDAITLVALVAACCFAVLVNPYGVGLPRAWLATMTMPLPELIQEHAPLDVTEAFGWTAVLLAAAYAVVLAGAFGRRPRVTWILPLVWFVLACQRIRNLPLFGVTVAVALADLLPHSRVSRWLAGRDLFRPSMAGTRRVASAGVPSASHGTRRVPTTLIPAVLVLASVLLQTTGIRAPVVGHDWVRFNPARWPVELLPELREIDRNVPDGTPIFNDLDYGGLVIYHAPRLRVFIDDRCALHGAERLTAYDRARQDEPAQLDRWHEEYRFPYALVQTGRAFDRHLQAADDWTLLRRAEAATLYRHTAGSVVAPLAPAAEAQ